MAGFFDPFSLTENPLATNWSTCAGIDGGMKSNGSVAQGATDYFSGSYYDGPTPADDQWAECTFPSRSGSGYSAGPAVRYSGGNAYFAECDDNNVRLRRITGGALATIGTFAGTFNSTDVCRIWAVGTTIAVFKNGALLGNATDGNHTSGAWAMYTWNNNNGAANHMDIGNFNAGDSAGGSILAPAMRQIRQAIRRANRY